jgi:ferredoxin/flavodoxin---NADP+ reductase
MTTMSPYLPQSKPFSIESVIALKHWTPSLLSITTTRPLELNYVPGQYARIAVQVNGQLVWRAFSFVSAPHERPLEFVAVLIPDGLFTSRLREIQPADNLWIEHENYGFLTADRFTDGEELWMLATGTGIGPFISMLRDDAVWRQFRRIFLVHGVRHGAELVYRDELLQMQSVRRDGGAELTLLCCLSRPGPGELRERTLEGRVTGAWDSGELERIAGTAITADASRVMLCGNPQMIEEMRARLHARGMRPCRRMTPGQFLTENYW